METGEKEKTDDGSRENVKPVPLIASLAITMLSTTEGFQLGYMDALLSIFRERGVPSNRLGLLTTLTWPFLLSFLAAPIVDRYYSASWGKRKTYLVPCKFVLTFAYFGIGMFADQAVSDTKVELLAGCLFAIGLVQLLDFNALLGIRYEVFGPERSDLASFTLYAGVAVGQCISYSLFVLLNSKYFCQEVLKLNTSSLVSHQMILSLFGLVNLASGLLVMWVKEPPTEEDAAKMLSTFSLAKIFLTHKQSARATLWLLCSCFGVVAIRTSVPLMLIRRGVYREHIVMLDAASLPVYVISNFCLKRFMIPGKIIKTCTYFLLGYLLFLHIDLLNIVSFDPAANYNLGLVLYMIAISLEGMCPWMSYHIGFVNSITYSKYAASYATTMLGLINLGKVLPITLVVSLLDFLPYPLVFVLLNLGNAWVLVSTLRDGKVDLIDATPLPEYHQPLEELSGNEERRISFGPEGIELPTVHDHGSQDKKHIENYHG